ncbi:hypothetical protein QOZ80_7BG0584820 [Eleusine coracana subsp. coracana]|nr:hypothetical protein QOZ80_7BG0584820 [Eleusine coracana subsp. coracana]
MAPLPSLMEELMEEILLRFPADDPGSLLRAALVCKSWYRLVFGPDFNHRFREFHQRSPPVLGFFCDIFRSSRYGTEGRTSFMSLTSFFDRLPHEFMPNWGAVDACRGRILFYEKDKKVSLQCMALNFIVWNPITGKKSMSLPEVPMKILLPTDTWNAALLCDDGGLGPFRVVVVVATVQGFTYACVYSSEQHVWSNPISTQKPGVRLLKGRNALIGNALYFKCNESRILEYDMSKQELSLISLPPLCWNRCVSLMTAEDSGLGFAVVRESKLCAWSREVDLDGNGRWTEKGTFELDKLLPFSDMSTLRSIRVFAVDNALSAVFVGTYEDGLFVIDLKFGRVRKIYKHSVGCDIHGFVPYVSICTPGTSSHSS